LFAARAPAAENPPASLRIANDSGRCSALSRFQPGLPTRITGAEWIAASAGQPWRSPEGFRDPAVVKVPFCRLSGELPTAEEAYVRFEVWLPTTARWNGRFFGTASGGSLGAIQYAGLAMPLERGFAAMAHDNGHVSANLYEQSWALDASTGKLRRERLVDFASRSQHLTTVVAKEAVAAFYGSPVRYAYYVGCSQGGHHGMMEAQRYPEDYNGIVAGAHGGSWTEMVAGEAWAAFQVTRDGGAGALTESLAKAVSRRAIEQCDGDDGLEDGQIADPRQCRFDPALMQCGTQFADPVNCLTPEQVEATRAIYAGPHTATGRKLAPGFAPGSEQYWRWTDSHEFMSGSYYDFYRLLVQADPEWDFLSLDWERDVDRGKALLGAIFDAVDPDLSRFRNAGGKLIMYHGWSDPLISPFLSLDTWEAMHKQMGDAATAEVARLFMIPGMAHCGYGPIGGTRDLHDEVWLTAIQRWVEEGIPPDGMEPEGTVVGFGAVGDIVRTRPYCPYPGQARYLGTGSIDRAANFRCEAR
jgi:feruloyl esterase